ncbi:MAG: cob(I)yrinic acid a,c-diamide adenosyltransferase [Phycisphaerales bacterium]|nr:cob(I)yrinic acid a,c-diamide adenosyltransferase [Phycisphaerales bacterium]
MVKLNKIYTRTGDSGETGLGSGARVPKDALRVECYGTVDEANAALGLAVGVATDDLKPVLEAIQNDLFDVGADLCIPDDPKEGQALRVTSSQTDALEDRIDTFNEPLAPLTSFVLPGGTELACRLHLARTIVRRAERLCVTLRREEPKTNPEVVRYLNRLSDLLFVLSRVANGGHDVLWVPGANR